MHIYLASDHAGFALKNALIEYLKAEGNEVEDCGPLALDPADDYPDFCMPLAQKVAGDKGSFGVVIGTSGQGEAIAANRVRGARAVVFYGGSDEILMLSREHNDANILSLGAKFLSETQAKDAVALWLATSFSGDERHVRRIEKLDTL